MALELPRPSLLKKVCFATYHMYKDGLSDKVIVHTWMALASHIVLDSRGLGPYYSSSLHNTHLHEAIRKWTRKESTTVLSVLQLIWVPIETTV